MDPHFGPAWIGFAHTFAAEGEHDQAISAYATAARLFQGTHLPQLFLGMQNLQLNNLGLAKEYLETAFNLCHEDPLVLNERGIVYYHEENLLEAISMFRRALIIAEHNDADKEAWLSTRTNLAHALRRYGQLDEALSTFDEVLRHGVKDAGVFTAKGLTLLELGRTWDAVVALHQALAVAPQDPMATELLNRALEDNQGEGAGLLRDHLGFAAEMGAGIEDEEVEDMERRIGGKLREIQQNRVAGRGGRRRGRGGEEGESAYGDSMVVDSDG